MAQDLNNKKIGDLRLKGYFGLDALYNKISTLSALQPDDADQELIVSYLNAFITAFKELSSLGIDS